MIYRGIEWQVSVKRSRDLIINSGLLFLMLILGMVLSNQLSAQQRITIKGQVVDAKNDEPLSFVSVSVKNKAIGSLTDDSGKFEFRANIKSGDSLQINYVGYNTLVLPLTTKSTQTFSIKLQEATYELEEILVTADPNPGKTLMKKVIAQNANNDPAKLNRLKAKRWEVKQIDLFDPKADALNPTKGLIFGDKAKIYASLRSEKDTLTQETPLYFAEKISDYELTSSPFSESEHELAVKTTGFETDVVLEKLVKWNAAEINLYSDWVLLFNKNFVSPVGTDAFSYYNFYIVDSVALSGGYYNITFQAIPKNWRDNVFTGFFTVNDSSFALVAADLKLSKDANINFIESITIQQKYAPALDVSTQTYRYTLTESILSLRYPANLESLGIPIPVSLGDKFLNCKMKVRHSDILLNTPKPSEFAKAGALVTSRQLLDSGHDDSYWNAMRPDSLSGRESAIYEMAKELNNNAAAKAKEKALSTLLSGFYYIDKKYVFGPLGSVFSSNRIEGFRLRLSARTMEDIFAKTGIYGHVAYGFKDKRFKSSVGVRHVWKAQPYTRSQLSFNSDYDVVIEWFDQSDKDNFMNSLLRKNVPYYRVFNQQVSLDHDQQLGANFLVHLGLNYQSLEPTFQYAYPNPAFISIDLTPQQPEFKKKVFVSDVTLGIRFAWHEPAKMFNYTRFPLNSKYPVIAFSYTQSIKINQFHFDYQKLSLNFNHITQLTPKIDYTWDLEFGRVLGTLPSLLLHQPTGSDTWMLSLRAFNLITPYEFTSDQYVELLSRLHLGGLFFDKIPILHKFKLRERFIFNAFWGDLSPDNKQFNTKLNPLTALKTPYMELGFGIDNIFNMFSINYIRRINYLDSPGSQGNHHGVFLGIKVLF